MKLGFAKVELLVKLMCGVYVTSRQWLTWSTA